LRLPREDEAAPAVRGPAGRPSTNGPSALAPLPARIAARRVPALSPDAPEAADLRPALDGSGRPRDLSRGTFPARGQDGGRRDRLAPGDGRPPRRRVLRQPRGALPRLLVGPASRIISICGVCGRAARPVERAISAVRDKNGIHVSCL